MGLKKIIDLDLLDRFLTKVKELIPTKTSDLTNDSGYMAGMTILSYGKSTWADFIEAYDDNKVVYCRASSNSNPATGSQTRMAFMAYVNNQTTPTNVEFQYYRSVNQHTDTQQGDQVFVYKLDKNSGWSVITRNAFSKVVAGTGLSSSYANSEITLINTLSVPDAATEAPAMNGTAAVGTSAKYAKEDHVHPSDTSKADKSSTVSNVSFNSSSSKIQKTINNTTSDVVGVASQSAAGLMSSTDKKKLDGLKPVIFQLESNNDGSYQDSPTGPFTVWTDVGDILFAYYAVHGNSFESSTFYGYNDVVLYYGNVNCAYGDVPCKYEEYELVDAVCTNGENPVVTLTFRTVSNNNGEDIVKTVTVTDTPESWDMFEDAIVTYTETPLSGTTYESKAAASGGTDVSLVTTGEKYTWNNKGTYSKPSGGIPDSDIASAATWNAKGNGTITGITMNGSSKGTSGVVNLGTVITAHQDISGKADKSSTVSNVAYDTTNKKITKTINGTTSDVVSAATLKTDMALSKSDVGLGNVDNVKQYSASNPPPYPVTSVNGNTGAVTVSVPSAATTAPKMDGTAAVGTSAKFAKEDHVHPSDTTKYTINNYGNGSTDVSIRPLVSFARANRFAFLPSDQIIIEKTTDGGTTWLDAGCSDAQKKALFANRGASIQIPLLNNAKSDQCGIRVTFTAMKYDVPDGTAETSKYNYWNSTYIKNYERYSNLREMWFWLSVNADTIRVQAYCATGSNPNAWVTAFDTNFGLTGWSGSDWIRLGGQTFGGQVNQLNNYWNWRVVFWSRIPDGKTTFQSTSIQQIHGISGYGDSVWFTPNALMKEDHLYNWDVDQNASFPANVTATKFIGNLQGNADSATNASKINNHTVNADVPSDAKFTDTTYESKAAASGGTDVSLVTTGEKYTWNNKGNGTITGITMNGASKGTSGVVDLGTVITAHQSLSGKQDKLVSGTNIKSINGVSLLGSGDLAVSGLPTVTSSDNDKVLKVVNGAWAAAEGGGGSSLTYTDAILHVNTLLGSSVTFTKDSISERLTSDAAHPNSDGVTADYYYTVQSANFGSWTITAALNGVYSSGTLSPSEAKQYDLSLRYKTQLYYKGNTFDSITGGWLLRPYNSNAIFSFDPNYININMNSSSGIIVTSSKIDVTDYKSLYFVFKTVTSIAQSAPKAYVALNAYEPQILDANNTSYLAHLEPRIAMSTTTGDNIVVKLDISSSEGGHYVEFAMSTNIVCKLEEVYLSPWS